MMENGTRPDVAMLEAWCRGEKLMRKGGNAIGFACWAMMSDEPFTVPQKIVSLRP